jgi:hypothetical protein
MWNDNPITLKKPLVMFDFFAYFFIIVGISMLIGTLIKFQLLNKFGLTSISYGFGIFIGIFLSIKLINKN